MSIAAMCAVMNSAVPDMTVQCFVVLTRLADCAAPNGTGARPSIDFIADRSYLSRRTVQRSLIWLADANVIKRTKQATGRGFVNVWAINLPLLERYAVKSKSNGEDDPPEFDDELDQDDLVHIEKGCHADTLLDDERVPHSHKRVPHRHPILSYPVLTLDAREKNSATGAASVQPEGRTPRNQNSKFENDLNRLIDDLDNGPKGVGFDAWANLVVAVVRRGEADAARSWLSRVAGCEVDGDGKILIAKNTFAKERTLQTFGGLLSEMGWQVVIKGSG